LNLTRYISRTVSREWLDQSYTSPRQLPKSKMVRSEYKKRTASDSTNIHTPENKTVADNPSCRNNDPARDNPRIRQRSNSTKSQKRESKGEEDRERGEPDYPMDDLLDFANTERPYPLSMAARRSCSANR